MSPGEVVHVSGAPELDTIDPLMPRTRLSGVVVVLHPRTMRWAGRLPLLAASVVAACGSGTSVPLRAVPSASLTRDPVVRIQLRVPADPAARMEVELTGDFATDQTLLRPAAAAVGAYRPAPFGRFFHEVAAFDAAGARLPIRTRAGVYVVEGALARLTYEVDGRAGEEALEDLTVSNHRRDGFTFVSGYATFLRVDGAEGRPHELRVRLPPGWRVATALEPVPGRPLTYRAANAFELLDEPLMVGEAFASLEVDDAISPGYVHLYGADRDPGPQLATLADAYRAAARGAEAIGFPPLTRPYHLFVELLPPAPGRRLGWAMEHDQSTILMYAEGSLSEADTRFTYHVMHEMLHAWIPRRLYTASLHPRAQLEAAPTAHIWFAEGFAQYLAYVAIARAGAIGRDEVLRMMARRFVRPYENLAPPEPISLEDHSRRICAGDHEHWSWQYGAGGLLALHIDQLMRSRDDGARGLPEAFAELIASATAEGIPDGALEARLSAATGIDLSSLFDRHVRGAERLDVNAILAAAGLSRAGGQVVVDAEPDDAARRFRERAF